MSAPPSGEGFRLRSRPAELVLSGAHRLLARAAPPTRGPTTRPSAWRPVGGPHARDQLEAVGVGQGEVGRPRGPGTCTRAGTSLYGPSEPPARKPTSLRAASIQAFIARSYAAVASSGSPSSSPITT